MGIAGAQVAAEATRALVPAGQIASVVAVTPPARRPIPPLSPLPVAPLEDLLCIECLGDVMGEAYTYCARCGNSPMHVSCGHRGYDAVGPTSELWCSDCAEAVEALREVQEAEDEAMAQRRVAQALYSASAQLRWMPFPVKASAYAPCTCLQ